MIKSSALFMLAFLLAGTIGTGQAGQAKKTSWSKQEFKAPLDRAVTPMFRLSKIQLAGSYVMPIEGYKEVPTSALQGGFQYIFKVAVGVMNRPGEVTIYTIPVLVENNGDAFTFSLKTAAISPALWEDVDKRLEDKKKKLSDKFKSDMEVKIAREGNGFLIKAVYPYAAGVTENDINDRLEHLFGKSYEFIFLVKEEEKVSFQVIWKQLKKSKPTRLTKAEFEILVFDLAGYDAKSNIAAEGSWYMGFKDRGIWIDNTGAQMNLWLKVKLPAGLTKEKKAKIMEQIMARAAKKPAKQSAASGAEWFGNEIWVKFTYPYDGMMSGDTIADRYNDFTYSYSKDLMDDCEDIIKDNK